MTKRERLTVLTLTCVGICIFLAVPLLGKMFPGLGRGGGILLGFGTIGALVLSPANHRLLAGAVALVCWGSFLFSAFMGGS